MFNSIKVIYRYFYKRYLIVSYACFIIIVIIIIWNILIRCFLDKNKTNFSKTFFIQEHDMPSVFTEKSMYHHYNDNDENIFYSNIIKNQSDCKNLTQCIDVYHYFVSSPSDKLNRILQEYSNHAVVNMEVIQGLLQKYPNLNNLSVGQTISWVMVSKQQLKCLIWGITSKEIRIYNNINNTFVEGVIKVIKKLNNELLYTVLFMGELNGTFINSARSLGLSDTCITDVINAFKYQLDFRKLRQGDRFSVLVSSKSNGNSNNDVQSKIIGARLRSFNKDYYIFRASNGKFYNQDAIRVGSNYIRFPILKSYRISSNFNLNRLNPVTRQISPHAGVDFAVPVGTPILSVGDGEVVVSKYSKIAGNYIVIKHNTQCVTRYMHLQKSLVKPGQKVRLGDNIALSGNTGRSTGPHLHFEVWINHRPVNPLTSHVLNIEKLSGIERAKYLNQVYEIIPKLNLN